MKAIMLMFDSLNRRYLPPYGCNWTKAPNFKRLAERSITFETSYVCSMPCMPARRDMHTGRPNFLHREWGPIEPYDDSMPEMLSRAGVYTHLATDHYHYWHRGGATYHTAYNSHEMFRGQEGDFWIPRVRDPEPPKNINKKGTREYWVNREHMLETGYHSQRATVDAGLAFLHQNSGEDNWFLTIECFDPHEPFFAEKPFREQYPSSPDIPLFDWPGYQRVNETEEEIEEVRHNYAALLTQCDDSLGRVMDEMDRRELWEDTMLIVWTDHGYLLGEHGWWAKNVPPLYDEVARTPFFIWDPRSRCKNERRRALVQPSIDLAPTLLRFFELEPTDRMLGKDLASVIRDDTPVRDAAIFGYFGNRVNITDGRYVYMRAPNKENSPLYSYTLMPTTFRQFYSEDRLRDAVLCEPFAFTNGCSLLKVPIAVDGIEEPDLLFDTLKDPSQEMTIEDEELRAHLSLRMEELMREADAPEEQFVRMGL